MEPKSSENKKVETSRRKFEQLRATEARPVILLAVLLAMVTRQQSVLTVYLTMYLLQKLHNQHRSVFCH